MYGAGTVIAGKYRIERTLGQGGMGSVVEAVHAHLGTPVALKFLHPHMVANQGVVERFVREARASAQLRSEHVCRVVDVGAEGGIPYIVMELLVGRDFQQILRSDGPFPVAAACEYLLQACVGLAEAHAAGIIHRDLKPGNLFWTQRPDGTALVKVLDFGVAKAPEGRDFSLTQTSSIIGSPGYMSPEQLKSSKSVDVRSDIWSLGIVLYELLSGKQPFVGESITELALRVAMDPTPPLEGMVSEPLQQVIFRCLEKDPARRFQNVGELAQALAPFSGVAGVELAAAVGRVVRGSVPPIMAPTMAVAATPTTLRGASGVIANPSYAAMPPPTRSWKVAVVVGAAVGLGVVAAIVVGNTKAGPGDEAHVAAPAAAPASAVAPAATADPADTPRTARTEEAAAQAEAAKADPAEAAKAEQAKLEAAKAAAARAEADKAAALRAEQTKAQAEADKADALRAEQAKAEAAKAEARAEQAKAEAAKQEAEAARAELAKARAQTQKAGTKTHATTGKTARTDTARSDAGKSDAKSEPKSEPTTTTATPKPGGDVGDSRF